MTKLAKKTSPAPWGAIFDLDGTMVDNAPFHERAWLAYCRRIGHPITRAWYRREIYGHTNVEIARVLFGPAAGPEQARMLEEEKEGLYRALYRPHIREIRGLGALLRRLAAAGAPCAVASNSTQANVDFVLDALELRRWFRAVVPSNEVSRGKPHPGLIREAARRLGLPPARCVVLEDSAAGVAAARRAGCRVVLIRSNNGHAVHAPDTIVRRCRDFTRLRVAELAHWAADGAAATSPR